MTIGAVNYDLVQCKIRRKHLNPTSLSIDSFCFWKTWMPCLSHQVGCCSIKRTCFCEACFGATVPNCHIIFYSSFTQRPENMTGNGEREVQQRAAALELSCGVFDCYPRMSLSFWDIQDGGERRKHSRTWMWLVSNIINNSAYEDSALVCVFYLKIWLNCHFNILIKQQ